jgi:DNA-binding LacI/PurR family transcriptional regulator
MPFAYPEKFDRGMTKLSDVAKKVGVSTATASLVFNNRPGVNAKTRKRVLSAAAELGYVPNNVARSLAMNQSRTIGLIVTDIENPFFGSLTRHIDEHARRNRFSLLLALSGDDHALEDRIIETFIGECVDGIIVVPTQLVRTEFAAYERLRKRGIPFVFSTTYYPGYDADYVMTDLELGSYRLTRYLLELGHQDIVFLVGADRGAPICALRTRGFELAYAERGLVHDASRIVPCARPDFQSGYVESQRLLEGKRPDAVITINDLLALGAQKAFKEAGYSIPRDISLAGYDDVIFASISDLHFTTVRQDIPEIARLTVELIIERILGAAKKDVRALIPPELLVRDSTGAPWHRIGGIGAAPRTRASDADAPPPDSEWRPPESLCEPRENSQKRPRPTKPAKRSRSPAQG